MLQFYYHPLSPLARRVWIALLEKKLEFEPIVVNLQQGEQLKPKFLQLNPFHYVPVLVDGDLRIIESLAIMDYLEQKYPQISLLPSNPEIFAKVKMAQMVTNSELGSQVIPLIFNDLDSVKAAKAKRNLKRICKFLSELLDDELYFGGNQFTVGDIVTGNGLILINKLGVELKQFPKIEAYCQRLMEREVWQQTQPSQEQLQPWKEFVKTLIKKKLDKK
ncbi:Glutathione S-transferase-like protein [Hyella patelloides LEGE 07179]|uniref:Glutathione S-transferase-like protein n=1 Tax=Hyella patelloides LEGE 07179 TaxID=945734 RepID=A0A563VTH3_9CYAN|nr:glutathione S-transferase family protein [Hyella patelloides]VEP14698.1 Glutathione S-transferase-like protein [Hyella patelloides LEGE 07179]